MAAIWALTLLAVAAAAATPWYAFATREALARRAVDTAAPVERYVSVSIRSKEPGQISEADPLREALRTRAGELPTLDTITEYAMSGRMTVGELTTFSVLARDGVCAHSLIEGACPAASGEIMIGQVTAERLGLAVGDTVAYTPEEAKLPVTLTVVGRYQPQDPLDPYWHGVLKTGPQDLEPGFTVRPTLDTAVTKVTTTVSLLLASAAYDGDLAHRLDVARQGLGADNMVVRTSADSLAREIEAEQQELLNGIAVAAARLVLLCGVALFVAVRHAAQAHRTDVGLVRLRGVRWWRVWTSSLAPTVSPMLTAAILGAPLGVLAGYALAGGAGTEQSTALAASLGSGAAVLVSAIVVAAVAQTQATRATVSELLRDVPARARTGRALDVVEIVVLLLAGVGVWQLISVAQTRTATVAPAAAPAVLALAAGLLVSRLLLALAARTGGWAARAGRLPSAFAALSASRRPALRWVVTLLVVAVAGLAGAFADDLRARPAIADRAALQVGAARVLTVTAPSRVVLRDAVREVDPDGRYAMAAAQYTLSAGLSDGVLAVDTARLARTALWRAEYGPLPTARDDQAPGWKVASGTLALDVTLNPKLHKLGRDGLSAHAADESDDVADTVYVAASLVRRDGVAVRALWGPLTPGRATYSATVEHCDDGCRIASFDMVTRDEPKPGGPPVHDGKPDWGTQVTLHAVQASGTDLVSRADLTDRVRWRGPVQPDALAAELSTSPDGLSIIAPPTCGLPLRGSCLPSAYPVGAPVPIPVVLAGTPGYGNRPQQLWLDMLGAPAVPVRVTGQVSALPRLGASGVLVDLTELDELAGVRLAAEQFQVWLTADAPESIVDELAKRQIRVLRSETPAQAADRLDDDAPAAIRRFALLAAILGLVIAATALLLAAASGRTATVKDLTALRVQGLPERAVRRAGLAFYGWPPAAATAAGLIAAVAAAALPVPPPKIFTDRWQVLAAPPGGVPFGVLVLAGAISAAVLVAAVGWATRRVTLAVRSATGTGRAGRPATAGPTGDGPEPGPVGDGPGPAGEGTGSRIPMEKPSKIRPISVIQRHKGERPSSEREESSRDEHERGGSTEREGDEK
ncbi:hypothetical protein HDA40_000901 [Hamadaea flava]|uniref:FtsX-like permease family protein n=1 Tax=Hamadaea flava TaxID=1742688 RepID=A0ABV8LRS5_9ACTN|nr:hypothetical protein [Hamadaea flava]MCP2322394.1 hypothetical protein [Hamadaea flava]